MRLISFERDGATRVGAWIDQDRTIVDLMAAASDPTPPARFATMQALIEAGERTWDEARGGGARAPPPGGGAAAGRAGGGAPPAPEQALVDTAAVRLLAPLPVPAQIRDFLCFEQHLLNSSSAAITILSNQAEDPAARRRELEASGAWKIPAIWYRKPYYYTASRFAVSHPEQDIVWPAYSNMLDYELEFAAVIGTAGIDTARENALDHVFGYTIFNDWSARDEQALVMEGRLGPGKGKDFDGSNGFGPCIVTADEIGNPYALTMTARVDGEEWSRGSTGSMHHRFEDCIAEVSAAQTLHPGEILCSGTVGTGCGVENLKFLKGGETVELEIERIGILRNRVVRDRQT